MLIVCLILVCIALCACSNGNEDETESGPKLLVGDQEETDDGIGSEDESYDETYELGGIPLE